MTLETLVFLAEPTTGPALGYFPPSLFLRRPRSGR